MYKYFTFSLTLEQYKIFFFVPYLALQGAYNIMHINIWGKNLKVHLIYPYSVHIILRVYYA